jgi:hypothetical protein
MKNEKGKMQKMQNAECNPQGLVAGIVRILALEGCSGFSTPFHALLTPCRNRSQARSAARRSAVYYVPLEPMSPVARA